MPFDYKVDATRNLAHVRGWGAVDFDSWLTAIQHVRADPSFVVGMPVLLDVREATDVPLPGQGPSVADAWIQHFPGSRIARVAPPGASYGIGRQIEILTHEQVRAFASIDEALEWVMGGPGPA